MFPHRAFAKQQIQSITEAEVFDLCDGSGVVRRGFPPLLHHPLRAGLRRDVEVEDVARGVMMTKRHNVPGR